MPFWTPSVHRESSQVRSPCQSFLSDTSSSRCVPYRKPGWLGSLLLRPVASASPADSSYYSVTAVVPTFGTLGFELANFVTKVVMRGTFSAQRSAGASRAQGKLVRTGPNLKLWTFQ